MGRTVLVVDQQPNLGAALGQVIAADGWDEVVQAETAPRALEVLAGRRIDVVTLDVRVGEADGVALLRAIRAAHPHVPAILLATDCTTAVAVEALRAGATAIVPKSVDPEELRAAIAAADAGHTWLPLALVGPVLDLLMFPPPANEWQELVESLSERERQVLQLMVDGLDRREIANRLTISLNTVRTHVKNILARLGVHSSLEAVSLALRAGLRPAVAGDGAVDGTRLNGSWAPRS